MQVHCCPCLQLETIACDANAVDGVGSASSLQLLNMDLSRPAGNQDPDSETAKAALAAARKLTKGEKEATLWQLAQEGWLKHHPGRSGHYCIGVSCLPSNLSAVWYIGEFGIFETGMPMCIGSRSGHSS